MARTGLFLCLLNLSSTAVFAQVNTPVPLEQQLLKEDPSDLAKAAQTSGDAKRGAVLFYQPYMACTKCHTAGEGEKPLGPDLTDQASKTIDHAHLVQSILEPSKKMEVRYQPWVVTTLDGKTATGLLVKETPQQILLRDPQSDTKPITIGKDQIEEQTRGEISIMPKGLVNQLASRQQFLDLVRYLMEIREKGRARAEQLKPPPSLYAARPLPEYEKRINHAGMIADMDRDINGAGFRRGRAIYNRLCVNCHGTHEQPGSLPTSLRFASGKFKNGRDPYRMYQTLTKGFGMMAPQAWMVPQQKYDVIHYVREAYLKEHNPTQYFKPTPEYLTGLPSGDTRGPKPSNLQPWITMDYGRSLIASYETPFPESGGANKNGQPNIAYKGIAIRLDPGAGGVSRGRDWMLFDHDTMRVAAAWSGNGFIDYNGIMFNGRHGVHPHVVGKVAYANPVGPGWASLGGDFTDQRLRGRDGRLYGPLPRDWARYRGLYHHGDRVILSYEVGGVGVLESPGVQSIESRTVFTRTLNIGARRRELVLQVAHNPRLAKLRTVKQAKDVVIFGPAIKKESAASPLNGPAIFNGTTFVEIDDSDAIDMTARDFTISARIKTRRGGTIFSKSPRQGPWAPNGKTFFVRGGRLAFDIGWVDVVQSRSRVDDGRLRDVAMTYKAKSGRVRLYVDGKLEGEKRLRPRRPVSGHVVRIGYTSADFPEPQSFFDGEIKEVLFYQRAFEAVEIAQLRQHKLAAASLLGRWNFASTGGDVIENGAGKSHRGIIMRGASAVASDRGPIAAGLMGETGHSQWTTDGKGNLRLTIPAGENLLRFTIWTCGVSKGEQATLIDSMLNVESTALDLSALTHGGPPRWNSEIKTPIVTGADEGPFAIDVLTRPASNPWFCRVRPTGFDFLPGRDAAAVCTWDGDVWMVTGLTQTKGELTWRRIASGLFQPLGVKVVEGMIYVSCRDQIVILHDLNGDGETDYYQNFNNDHQVTEHFHEFAMGLQTDKEGNFYYAKSARHALKALAPHHGTLLRVSKDGGRTDILATGFRAANGVCVNDDGTFIVTDQEGHWNPKNRINWVREGGFYGNMWGYHDVTDTSDQAMQQPLCWITNAFDRSPAELLWVDSRKWGPLHGSLLNMSYGYGQVYVVPHEKVRGQMQGGMCAFPLPRLPTGLVRGRFHPDDGQLYLCGMFAWAGSQQQPGGFYRFRYTGKPMHLPIELHARSQGMEIRFTEKLDRAWAEKAANYSVKTWSLKRTANYGSDHHNEKRLDIRGVTLGEDGQTVFIELADLKPTWCMEIKYSLKSAQGEPFQGVIHNTIHHTR